MLWEAGNSKDNDAVDRLLDSGASAVSLRASDGRGLAWWGYEFQNAYLLGAILAYGGDIETQDEDLEGNTPLHMCEQETSCNKDEIIAKAKELSVDIRERKEQRAKELSVDIRERKEQ